MPSSIKLFNLLSDDYRLWMLEKCEIIRLKKGETLRQAGDQHHHIYIIIKGHVSVFEVQMRVNDCPISQKIAVLKPGEIVGANAALAMQPTVPAMCCEDNVIALKIDERLLDEKVMADPKFALQLHAALRVLSANRVSSNDH